MPDVFISYSRRDEAFVGRLREALATGGKDVWVDKEDIGPAEEWRRDIQLGIEGADIFAFVITPDALASEHCRREREHAVAKNKRLVPLLHREPDGVPVPEELASRNYIFFRSEPEFAPGVASLLAAIENLPEWARAHTRLLERAEEWDHRGRDRSFLLRGSDLRDAEGWLAEQGAHKEPQPTPLQSELILASRKEATRRQRLTIGAVLVALAVAVMLAIVALLQRNEANEQRDEAVRQARVAQSRQLASAAVSQLPVDPELSVLLARQAASVRPTDEAEHALRSALARSHVEATMRGHDAWVATAAYDAPGERVVTASRDGRAALWDPATGDNLAWLEGHEDWVSWAAFSPDGRTVATASRDGTARLWDAATGEERAVLAGHGDYVSRVVFSPDGTRVVTTGRDATARLWDVASGEALRILRGHRKWVVWAEFTPDGERIVTGSDDGTVRIWSARTGVTLAVLRPRAGEITALVVSPDGRRIFTGSFRKAAILWDAATGRALERLPLEAGFATVAAYSSDGRVLAVGNDDGTVRLWNASGELLEILGEHTGPVADLAFSPDGRRLVTASGDGTAKAWLWAERRVVEELRGHGGWVTTAGVAPDGRTILTASQDGTARVWDGTFGQADTRLDAGLNVSSASFGADGASVLTSALGETTLWNPATAEPELSIPSDGVLVNDADLSRDERRIVTAGEDGVARLYAASDGSLVDELAGHAGRLTSASFGAGADSILTSSADGTARIWNAATGEARVLAGHEGDVRAAAFSPDGSRVVTAGDDQTARIWDAGSGDEVRLLRGHSNIVLGASFSADGRRVATASSDNTARIWDAATGRTRVVLSGHTQPVNAARFSPDGRFVVTASFDGTARVWDAATGEELLALGDGALLNDAAFAPDGLRIVTGGFDGKARLYTCEVCRSLGGLLREAGAAVTRGLTAAERREFLGQG